MRREKRRDNKGRKGGSLPGFLPAHYKEEIKGLIKFYPDEFPRSKVKDNVPRFFSGEYVKKFEPQIRAFLKGLSPPYTYTFDLRPECKLVLGDNIPRIGEMLYAISESRKEVYPKSLYYYEDRLAAIVPTAFFPSSVIEAWIANGDWDHDVMLETWIPRRIFDSLTMLIFEKYGKEFSAEEELQVDTASYLAAVLFSLLSLLNLYGKALTYKRAKRGKKLIVSTDVGNVLMLIDALSMVVPVADLYDEKMMYEERIYKKEYRRKGDKKSVTLRVLYGTPFEFRVYIEREYDPSKADVEINPALIAMLVELLKGLEYGDKVVPMAIMRKFGATSRLLAEYEDKEDMLPQYVVRKVWKMKDKKERVFKNPQYEAMRIGVFASLLAFRYLYLPPKTRFGKFPFDNPVRTSTLMLDVLSEVKGYEFLREIADMLRQFADIARTEARREKKRGRRREAQLRYCVESLEEKYPKWLGKELCYLWKRDPAYAVWYGTHVGCRWFRKNYIAMAETRDMKLNWGMSLDTIIKATTYAVTDEERKERKKEGLMRFAEELEKIQFEISLDMFAKGLQGITEDVKKRIVSSKGTVFTVDDRGRRWIPMLASGLIGVLSFVDNNLAIWGSKGSMHPWVLRRLAELMEKDGLNPGRFLWRRMDPPHLISPAVAVSSQETPLHLTMRPETVDMSSVLSPWKREGALPLSAKIKTKWTPYGVRLCHKVHVSGDERTEEEGEDCESVIPEFSPVRMKAVIDTLSMFQGEISDVTMLNFLAAEYFARRTDPSPVRVPKKSDGKGINELDYSAYLFDRYLNTSYRVEPFTHTYPPWNREQKREEYEDELFAHILAKLYKRFNKGSVKDVRSTNEPDVIAELLLLDLFVHGEEMVVKPFPGVPLAVAASFRTSFKQFNNNPPGEEVLNMAAVEDDAYLDAVYKEIATARAFRAFAKWTSREMEGNVLKKEEAVRAQLGTDVNFWRTRALRRALRVLDRSPSDPPLFDEPMYTFPSALRAFMEPLSVLMEFGFAKWRDKIVEEDDIRKVYLEPTEYRSLRRYILASATLFGYFVIWRHYLASRWRKEDLSTEAEKALEDTGLIALAKPYPKALEVLGERIDKDPVLGWTMRYLRNVKDTYAKHFVQQLLVGLRYLSHLACPSLKGEIVELLKDQSSQRSFLWKVWKTMKRIVREKPCRDRRVLALADDIRIAAWAFIFSPALISDKNHPLVSVKEDFGMGKWIEERGGLKHLLYLKDNESSMARLLLSTLTMTRLGMFVHKAVESMPEEAGREAMRLTAKLAKRMLKNLKAADQADLYGDKEDPKEVPVEFGTISSPVQMI